MNIKFMSVKYRGVDPLTAGIASAVVGGLLQSSMSPDTPTANVPKPTDAPQSAQAPDATQVRQSNTSGAAAGGGSGPSSTLLTGSQGVDPNKLQLATTLLTGDDKKLGS